MNDVNQVSCLASLNNLPHKGYLCLLGGVKASDSQLDLFQSRKDRDNTEKSWLSLLTDLCS